jgi:hypothetical protein
MILMSVYQEEIEWITNENSLVIFSIYLQLLWRSSLALLGTLRIWEEHGGECVFAPNSMSKI